MEKEVERMTGKSMSFVFCRFFTAARVDAVLGIMRSSKKIEPKCLEYLERIGKATNVDIEGKI